MFGIGRKKLGLALGGGAARGLAHIGVLRACEEAGLPIAAISGTSMGAIIGAMYADNPLSAPLQQRVVEYLDSDLFKKARLDFVEKEKVDGEGLFYRFSQLARRQIFFTLAMSRSSFVSQETTDNSIAFLLPDTDIERARIPFGASALDLNSGKEVLLRKGRLRTAIAATSAIPGVLPPVHIDNMLLVDGGWIDAVPVAPCRELGAELVVAVDVCSDIGGSEGTANGVEIVFRADAATRNALSDLQLQQADLVIRPDVGNNHWADFSQPERMIEEGYKAARDALPKVKRLLRGRSFRLRR